MESRTELNQKIFEIFKDFMTGVMKLEELDNAGNRFLLGFQQGLSFLQRPPIDSSSSKLIENIIKKNETKRLKSYVEAGCINTNDAAKSLQMPKSLLDELELLTKDADLAIQTAIKSTPLEDKSCEDELTLFCPREPKVTDYGALIAIIYSMVMQNYVMQEKIVKSLGLESSPGELETYTLMWSLRPFVDDEIMNQAWKLIP